MAEIKISSNSFADGGQIPKKHGYKNKNISPQLSFAGQMPEKARSLALIMDDPDAMKPAGKVWSHWLVWNMPTSTTQIKEGSVPPTEAVEGTTDFGSTGYGGPAPPDGEHVYIFALYALDTVLDLPAYTTKNHLENVIKPHILAKAELRGRYSPD